MNKEEILRTMLMRAVIADDPMSDLGEYLGAVTPLELRWAESKAEEVVQILNKAHEQLTMLI